jgi:hypothetical protein
MKVEQLSSFPANSNPFNHDLYHMGQLIGSNCTIMFENHSDHECKYIIIVNTQSGERLQVWLSDEPEVNHIMEGFKEVMEV